MLQPLIALIQIIRFVMVAVNVKIVGNLAIVTTKGILVPATKGISPVPMSKGKVGVVRRERPVAKPCTIAPWTVVLSERPILKEPHVFAIPKNQSAVPMNKIHGVVLKIKHVVKPRMNVYWIAVYRAVLIKKERNAFVIRVFTHVPMLMRRLGVAVPERPVAPMWGNVFLIAGHLGPPIKKEQNVFVMPDINLVPTTMGTVGVVQRENYAVEPPMNA